MATAVIVALDRCYPRTTFSVIGSGTLLVRLVVAHKGDSAGVMTVIGAVPDPPGMGTGVSQSFRVGETSDACVAAAVPVVDNADANLA